jgi:hypothetical protein
MATHPDERREMGQRGCKFVREHYSKQRLIGDIEKLYYELVGFARKRPNNGD